MKYYLVKVGENGFNWGGANQWNELDIEHYFAPNEWVELTEEELQHIKNLCEQGYEDYGDPDDYDDINCSPTPIGYDHYYTAPIADKIRKVME